MRANPAEARLIVAVSLGAVFFGAMTYIGNGPILWSNRSPSLRGESPYFRCYILRYSLPILLPILLASGLLFF